MADITLDFIGEQLRRVLDEQRATRDSIGSLRDDMTVLTGIAMRMDSTLQGLVTEIRGIHRQQARLRQHDERLDARLDAIEARLAALEEA
jgi:chromosome segregation ATPase